MQVVCTDLLVQLLQLPELDIEFFADPQFLGQVLLNDPYFDVFDFFDVLDVLLHLDLGVEPLLCLGLLVVVRQDRAARSVHQARLEH